MAESILLISALPEDHAFAKAVGSQAQVPVEILPNAQAGAEFINKHEPATVFVDTSTETLYQQFEEAIQNTVGIFSDKINANAIHFLSSENLDKVRFLIQSPLFGHFILRNYGDPKASGEHYGRIVRAAMSERAFGLSGLVRPGTKVQTVRLHRSSQKQDAVDAVKNFFVAAKFQSRMAGVIANAVDELLMNAMFDAPVDDVGKQIYATAPRSQVFELKDRQAVELQVAFDGNIGAVTAIDLFGSMDKVKLLNHISKIYTEEEYRVRTSIAGAGLGLATVFRTGGSVFFVSESGVRTEVTVFFRRAETYREFRDQFRFLSTQFYF